MLLPHSIKNVAKQGEEKYDQRVVNLLRPGGGQFAPAGDLFLAVLGVVNLHRPEGGQYDRFFHKSKESLQNSNTKGTLVL